MKNQPKPVGAILGEASSRLEQLLGRVEILRKLDQTIKQQLPEPMHAHCQVANIKENQLVIFADSQAWATRLRYQRNELISSLKKSPEFARINDIEIKVRSLC